MLLTLHHVEWMFQVLIHIECFVLGSDITTLFGKITLCIACVKMVTVGDISILIILATAYIC
jgi:hypothetical protein